MSISMSDVKSPSDPQGTTPIASATGNANDLMNRLQSFLPQMKAANQALSTENPERVDLHLESEKDDSDDDDDESDNNQSGDEDDTCKNETKIIADGENPTPSNNPTIQIEFALGKMKDNPMMKILAGGDESDDSSEDDEDSSVGGDDNTRKRAVEKLLADNDSKNRLEPPSKKKPMITEL